MDTLAIDLGTKTGYAYNRGSQIYAGTWTLASTKEVTAWGNARLTRRKDPRIRRLCEHVSALGNFDVILFEDVQFVSTTYQAHLWASLRAAVWLCGVCDYSDCVPVKTLKLFATGNGNATKEAMAKALSRESRFAGWDLDDNGVDAVWLWLWAEKNLTRLVTSTTLPK